MNGNTAMNLLLSLSPITMPAMPRLPRRIRLVLSVAGLVVFAWVAGAQSSTNTLLWLKGGHASKVNGVAWSADGSLIASASDDATVKLWTTNGALVRTLITHPYQATALAFSPDATKLAVGTYSGGYIRTNAISGNAGLLSSNGLGVVFIWQATNGWSATNVSILRSLTNRYGRITSVAFSADGTKLASSVSGGSNYVHQVSTWSLLATNNGYTTNKYVNMEINAPILGIAFSAGGLLASACEDGTVRIWNSAFTKIWSTNLSHASNVTAVAFSPDGSRLASASLDGTVQVWTTNSWTNVVTFIGHSNGVTSVAFSPNGNLIATGGEDQTIKVWNAASGACLATATGHVDAVCGVAFSADSTRVVSGGVDNSVRLWSAANGALIQNFGAHSDMVKAIAVSPNGRLCATAANDQSIQVRRLADGLLLNTLPGHTGCVSTITFAADSAMLASGGGPLDPTVKLWRLSDNTLLRTIAASTNGVMALAFSPDGTILASGGDYDEKTIRLWNANDGSLLRTLNGQSNGVTALAFSTNGDLLVSGGRRFNTNCLDSTVKVWAVTNGSLVRAFACYSNNTESVAFSPDGNSVAAGGNCSSVTNNSSTTNLLTIWKISDGSSRIFGSDTNPVFFVAFSPDGSTLASAAKDAIKFWNVVTGSVSQTFTQETFRASCLAYSPGGNLFAYGREDATVAAFSLTSSLSFTNHSPIAGTDSFGRVRCTSLKIKIADLLTNDTDSDLDYLTVAGINLLTTNGVTLTTNATTIFYSNSANVDDQFTYLVRDNYGGSDTGTVLIRICEATSSCSVVNLQTGVPGPNTNTLVFAGIPNYEYVVQFATNLTSETVWFNLNTNVAGTNGLWSVIDPSATSTQRFYRVMMP
jgi:WD40 repeat protein